MQSLTYPKAFVTMKLSLLTHQKGNNSMTKQELWFLQRSANLCNQRNQLLNKLNGLKAQKNAYAQKLPNDPYAAAKAAGEEAVRNRIIPPIWVWCLAMVACIVPFIISCIIYKIAQIESEYFLLIGIGIGFVAFFVVVIHCRNVDRKNVRKRAEKRYLAEYKNTCQQNQSQLKQLAEQVRNVTQEYNILVTKMQDPNQCCIPASHWYHGQELYRLVNDNRAGTLQEAIRIQSKIEAQDAAYWKSVADYPRQVEEQIARDNRQFLDDMERMALLGIVLSDK